MTFYEWMKNRYFESGPINPDEEQFEEDYYDWISQLDLTEVIIYAGRWHKQEMAKETKRTIDLLDEVIKVLKELK